MFFLPLPGTASAEMIRADQASHQKKGGQFDPDQIRLIESNGHLFRAHGFTRNRHSLAVNQKESHLCDQNRR